MAQRISKPRVLAYHGAILGATEWGEPKDGTDQTIWLSTITATLSLGVRTAIADSQHYHCNRNTVPLFSCTATIQFFTWARLNGVWYAVSRVVGWILAGVGLSIGIVSRYC